MSLRVLLVDDHAVVLQGLRAYLELQADITVCAEAADASAAVSAAAESRPEMALVDLVMPEEVACRRRAESVPAVRRRRCWC